MVENNNGSLLATIGNAVAIIFAPLGWVGTWAWKATVATVTGLIATEEVVSTFGVLYNFSGELSGTGEEIWAQVGQDFGSITAYSFMLFNLLCAPLFCSYGRDQAGNEQYQMDAGSTGLYHCICLFRFHDHLPVWRPIYRQGDLRCRHGCCSHIAGSYHLSSGAFYSQIFRKGNRTTDSSPVKEALDMKGYKGVGSAKRPVLKKIDNSHYYSWYNMKKREKVKKAVVQQTI